MSWSTGKLVPEEETEEYKAKLQREKTENEVEPIALLEDGSQTRGPVSIVEMLQKHGEKLTLDEPSVGPSS